MANANVLNPRLSITYNCRLCGKSFKTAKGNFYKSSQSLYFQRNSGYGDICSVCLQDLYTQANKKYKSERMALITICSVMDWYYDEVLYESVMRDRDTFSAGVYARLLNNVQYRGKTFITSVVEGKLGETTIKVVDQTSAGQWSKEENQNRQMVIDVYGYDPFPADDFQEKSRKYLYNTLVDFLDEETQDDAYKKSQILQIVINNEMIQKCNAKMAALNPTTESGEIKALSDIITAKVGNNDKIAKENEISVKNRSNKKAGKGTFTYLQRELREKNFDAAETNYYKQLQSEGSLWAIEQSMKAIRKNGFFDESDQKEMFDIQRELIVQKDKQLDDELEKNRLLNVEIVNLTEKIEELNKNNKQIKTELTELKKIQKNNKGEINDSE